MTDCSRMILNNNEIGMDMDKELIISKINEYIDIYYIKPFDMSGIKFSINPDTVVEENKSKDSDKYDINTLTSLMNDAIRNKDRSASAKLDSLINKSFVEKLIYYIQVKDLNYSDVYKSVNMDRRLFSKMISDKHYTPSKDTAILMIFALKLNLFDAEDLLERAGYSLSHSNRRDLIIEYCINAKYSDITLINEILYEMNEKVLGR